MTALWIWLHERVQRYAVVVGEALVDLIESSREGEAVYRPLVGGAPLNVATGLRRLGAVVEFVGSLSSDALGVRIRDLLRGQGVSTAGCVTTEVPTTLALTSLHDGEPEFTFYGNPPSFAQLGPAALDTTLVGGASVLYCGSIALMYEESRAAAQAAWAVPGPVKVLDPNVRPTLLRDSRALRSTVEELAATADLVKLSEPDAAVLFDLGPEATARHLRAVGAAAVVVTRGAAGAVVHCSDVDGRDRTLAVAAPTVDAIDTTGAGDACMAALMYGLMSHGTPTGAQQWRELTGFATTAAALACEVPGGATAMPTLDAIAARRPAV